MHAPASYRWATDVLTGLFGAAVLAIIEVASLVPHAAGVAWVTAALIGAGGLLFGAALAGTEAALRRLEPRPLVRAGARAALFLPAFAVLGRQLFDGGFASTLPGASLGPILVPIGGVGGVAGVLWLGARVIGAPGARPAIAFALASLVVAVEVANRGLFRTQYPDVHLFLLFVGAAAAGLSARLVWAALAGPEPGRRAALATVGVGVAIAGAFVAALFGGLAEVEHRRAVAEHGMHTRQVVKLVRDVADTDGDGCAPVLGGGECAPAPEAEAEPPDAPDAPRSPAARKLLARTAPMNVLLVSVDALRGDALGRPEDRRELPALARLYAAGVSFRRAFSTSAGTDVALPGLLTGRINPWDRVDRTMAEALRGAGRATHAVIPREVFRWVGEATITRGLDGFDRLVTDPVVRDKSAGASSRRTTQLGLGFLDRLHKARTRKPFFLWLHYFDVHDHKDLAEHDPELRAAGWTRPLATRHDRYRASLVLVDRAVGALFAELERRGLWEQTVVVLASDHGESLNEDPRLPEAHGQFVYNALVHVPLVVRVPGLPAKASDAPVSVVDVAPTLVELAGGGKLPRADGASLVPQLMPGAPPPRKRALVMNETEQHGVVEWPWKLLVRPRDNLAELYDLERDFAERRDLAAASPEVVAALTRAYRSAPAIRIDRTSRARRERELRARAAAQR